MESTLAAPPAHQILRERTRDAHESAEATEGMRRLIDGRMDEVGYGELLAAQLRLFRQWEGERAAWLQEVAPSWLYRSRVATLESDLAASPFADTIGSHPFGSTRPAEGGGSRSYRRILRSEASDVAAWGELYVIEGSTLGGRLIVRHLRERFPALPHHYYAMGETTPTRWRTFQSVLDAALPDDDAQRQAVDGAHRMFACFQQALQDPAAHV